MAGHQSYRTPRKRLSDLGYSARFNAGQEAARVAGSFPSQHQDRVFGLTWRIKIRQAAERIQPSRYEFSEN